MYSLRNSILPGDVQTQTGDVETEKNKCVLKKTRANASNLYFVPYDGGSRSYPSGTCRHFQSWTKQIFFCIDRC